jgi:hypothetical protein
VKVWFGYFIQIDTEDPGIKFESGNTKKIREFQLVEDSPPARHCLERQCRQDLDLPWSAGPDSGTWRGFLEIKRFSKCLPLGAFSFRLL